MAKPAEPDRESQHRFPGHEVEKSQAMQITAPKLQSIWVDYFG